MCDFGDFTLFSAFQKNDEIYLVLSVNNEPVDIGKLVVLTEQGELMLETRYTRDKGEGSDVLVYKAGAGAEAAGGTEGELDLFVQYKEDCRDVPCPVVNIPKQPDDTMVLTTLFKDDWQLFPCFHDYYKRLGVSHYYMYYNGIPDESITSLFNQYPDVTLIPWDFRYWNHTSCKIRHHAQMGQMHDALHRYGKGSHKYMIFCDLDEYLILNGTPTSGMQAFFDSHQEVNTFDFGNVWAHSSHPGDLTNVEADKKFDGNLNVSSFPFRHKCVYRLDKPESNILCIHCPENKENMLPVGYLLHFYDWSRPGRKEPGNYSKYDV